MKKLLLFVFVILSIMSINAQEKGKFRIGLDLGLVFASSVEEYGRLLSLELKYNLTGNSSVGLRIGVAYYVISNDEPDFFLDGNTNFSASYDYYFSSEDSSTSPFLGIGLGIYRLSGFEINFNHFSINDESEFGGMIRGGIELGKLRLAFEYNIIPKTDFESGGSISNSYFGVSIGFYVGGGKWKK